MTASRSAVHERLRKRLQAKKKGREDDKESVLRSIIDSIDLPQNTYNTDPLFDQKEIIPDDASDFVIVEDVDPYSDQLNRLLT